MSEKKNSPETVSEFLSEEALDRMLAEMAQETPEMPADFHGSWTEKIRAEAARETAAAPGTGKNACAGAAETGKRKENRRQWRYILSAAAVFVFLIGGTLLTRHYGKDSAKNVPVTENVFAAENTPAAETEERQTAAAGLSNTAPDAEENREPEIYAEMEEAAEEDAGPEIYADMAAGAAANAVPEAFAALTSAPTISPTVIPETFAAMTSAPTLRSTALPTAVPAAEATASVLFAAKKAEQEAAAAEEEPGEAAEINGEVPEENMMMEEADAGMAADPAEEAAGAEEEKEQENEFVDFLKDLGIFTLKTLAVAAAVGVLVFGAAAVYRALKKRKN